MSDNDKTTENEETSDSKKKLSRTALVIAVLSFIPLVFLFISGVEQRGVLYASMTMGAVLAFGFLFCRIVSKIIQKYCEYRGIVLATQKYEIMSRYDPGIVPTVIIKISRIVNMIAGGVLMWWLSNEFNYEYVVISVIAGLILFTAVQGKDITVDVDALKKEREEKIKTKKEKKARGYNKEEWGDAV